MQTSGRREGSKSENIADVKAPKENNIVFSNVKLFPQHFHTRKDKRCTPTLNSIIASMSNLFDERGG